MKSLGFAFTTLTFWVSTAAYCDVSEKWELPAHLTSRYEKGGTRLVIEDTRSGKKIVWDDRRHRFANGTFIILTDEHLVSRAFDMDLNELAHAKSTRVATGVLYMAYTGGNDKVGYIQIAGRSGKTFRVFTQKGVLFDWTDYHQHFLSGPYFLLTDTHGIAEVFHHSSSKAIIRWSDIGDEGFHLLNSGYFFLSDTRGTTRVYDYKGKEIAGYKKTLKSQNRFKEAFYLEDTSGTGKVFHADGTIETLTHVTKTETVYTPGEIYTAKFVITYDGGKIWEKVLGIYF